MALEDGFTALDEFQWELGGLRWDETHEDGDEGLDDLPDVEDDAADAAGDGEVGGDQRLAAKAITLTRWLAPDETDPAARAVAFAAQLDAIREVMSRLPDPAATRLLRWRRPGEVAKRIAVRPAVGRPLSVPAARDRLIHDRAKVTLRLTAPDPVTLSDEYHEVTFTAGQTREIVNAGTFTARQPIAWSLTAPGPVTIEHLDYPDEWIRFPAGPVTVTRDLTIDAPDAFGVCWGRDGSPFPAWPLLRPGTNRIRASAVCTLRWRDTW